MTDEERKTAYAVFLFSNPGNYMGAGINAYPELDDRGTACRVAIEWRNDPFVVGQMEELKNEKEDIEGIPTKADVMRKLWEMAKEPYSKLADRVKAVDLLSELMGEKKSSGAGGPTINNNLNIPSEPTYKIVEE